MNTIFLNESEINKILLCRSVLVVRPVSLKPEIILKEKSDYLIEYFSDFSSPAGGGFEIETGEKVLLSDEKIRVRKGHMHYCRSAVSHQIEAEVKSISTHRLWDLSLEHIEQSGVLGDEQPAGISGVNSSFLVYRFLEYWDNYYLDTVYDFAKNPHLRLLQVRALPA